jgi:hypothetical protein
MTRAAVNAADPTAEGADRVATTGKTNALIAANPESVRLHVKIEIEYCAR